MRVAFVDQTGDVIGGAQESLWLLLTHLPADIVPIVVLFHDGPFAARIREYGIEVAFVPVSGAVAGSTRNRVSLRGLLEIPSIFVRLVRLFRSLRLDAVHTNTVKAHFLALPSAYVLSLPRVAHLRDILSGASRTALQLILRLTNARVVVISSTVGTCFPLKSASIVRNPVDLRQFAVPRSRHDARADLDLGIASSLLFAIVGRVNKWKGHDRFLEAAKLVNGVAPDVHFAIVGEPRFGDETFLTELRALANRLDLHDRVHFVPWQSNVTTLYRAIDVLVNCSDREPFGRTVVEAGAASVPAICFDDAGVAEFMREAGIGGIVKAGDVAALAEMMIAYARDGELRTEAGRRASALAQSFDAVAHARAIGEILRGAAAAR